MKIAKQLEEQNLLFEVVDYKGLDDDEYVYLEEEFEDVYGEEPGEIALCVLAAYNLGAIKSLEEMEEIAENKLKVAY